MSMNGINSAGMTTNGRVVHVAAAENVEAGDDVDDFVRVDADGVLEAAFVVVEPVRNAVLRVVADAHGGAGAAGDDSVVGQLHAGRVPVEDLERVEVEVDRVGCRW
jgi:hypothetical protein